MRVLVTLVALAALALLLWTWLGPETPVQAARRLVRCALSGDGACVLRYVRPEERRLLGLDADGLSQFLRTIVDPELRGFVAEGSPEVVQYPDQRLTVVAQVLRNPDGRTATLAFSVGPTDDGIKTVSVVGNLYLAVMDADWPARVGRPRGTRRMQYWVDETKRLLPRLEASGVEGVVLDVDSRVTKYTWREFVDHQFAGLARAATASSSR